MDVKLLERNATLNASETKSRETIKQQQKLIDLLHVRIEEQPKKRNFFLFGGSKKENTPPISLPLNYKDLEQKLQKEKATNKALQEEIFKLKAEGAQKVNEDCVRQIAKVSRNMSDIVSPKSKTGDAEAGAVAFRSGQGQAEAGVRTEDAPQDSSQWQVKNV